MNKYRWERVSEDPEVHAEHQQDDAGDGALHVHGSAVELRGAFLVLLGKHRKVLCLCVQLRQHRATLQNVVDVLHHDPLHVLQLVVYCVYVSSPVRQRFLRLLDVNVKLDKLIRPRHRVDLSTVAVVELLRQVLEIVEGDAFGKHFVAQHQVTNVVLDEIAGGEISSDL